MNKDYIYKRRLLKLADHLDTVPQKQFNFGRWVGRDWRGKSDLSCGTSACSLGWATTIPSFRKLGLRLFTNGSFGYVGLKQTVSNSCAIDHSMNAAKFIFGVSNSEFEFLFIPSRDLPNDFKMFGKRPLKITASPKEASAHIRFFVANKYGK